ncbi:MAG: hypothetical protein DCC75_08560, partial [Proteobacteria bacterium]
MTSSSAIRCKSTGKLFSLSPDQIEFYRKLEVPFPALCPEERLRRRLAYHNRIYVYRRNSSATGQPIFSMYAPDAPFPVIEKETWWGDSWDGCDFGRSYEFNTAFFNQFRALRREVPTFPLSTVRVENSEYINNSTSV